MKKVFLLGTMLGVASAALAFGGGGGHGRISTTYKGGVDAIGVHFGGKSVCAPGLLRNTDGTCSVCENGNIYFSFEEDPCGTETPMYQDKCEEECWNCPCEIVDHNRCFAYYWDKNNQLTCLPSATPCKSNNDCEPDEYCNLVSVDTGASAPPNLGACAPLGEAKTISYNGIQFLKSENKGTWWGAENWCRAQGKKMATLADFGIMNKQGCCGDECPIDWDAFLQSFDTPERLWLEDGTDVECAFSIYLSDTSGCVVWGGADAEMRYAPAEDAVIKAALCK